MTATTSAPPMAQTQRILATIVFTDVVGFSARMQVDEDKTIALVRRDLGLFTKICTQNDGKVIKNTGDGLLMFFTSIDAALKTSGRILEALDAAGRKLTPDQRLEHRIGIHLGDVILENQDVMGDGVNIAARLMAEALPDTVCLSQPVFDMVKKRTSLHATPIGERRLKNIKEPVSAVLLSFRPPLGILLPDDQASPASDVLQTMDPAESDDVRKRVYIGAGIACLVALAFAGFLLSGAGESETGGANTSGLVITEPSIERGGLQGQTSLTRSVFDDPEPVTPVAQVEPVVTSTQPLSAPAVEPVAPPAPSAVAAPVPTTLKSIDLLAQVEVARDRVMGQWVREPGGVVCLAPEFPVMLDPRNATRLRMPLRRDRVPAQYDLKVTFTRQSGTDSIAILFQLPNGDPATFEIDAWGMHLAGFQPINGRNLDRQEQTRFNFRLNNDEQYEVVIRVRQDRVVAVVDGEERLTVPYQGNRLTRTFWDLPEDYPLGVGAYKARTLFHAIELTLVE